MNISLLFFYIFLLFLPTQLGRHFFFDFSLVSGIRSDYLTPTLFLTDIFIIFIILSETVGRLKKRHKLTVSIPKKLTLIILGYLLVNSLFIAGNGWVSLYKFIKISEFILFGFAIIRIKPDISKIITFLTVDVFYLFFISLLQFISQQSIGGIFWFLGERTFYAGTPGIALISLNGGVMLRPYATFPHPNVLGGFLATVLPLIFQRILVYNKNGRKSALLFLAAGLLCGLFTLFITFSRAAWMAASLGFIFILINYRYKLIHIFKKKRGLLLSVFYFLMISSVIVFFINPKRLPIKGESWNDRKLLAHTAITMASQHPFFGIGLNNYVVRMSEFASNYAGISSFQPVHNIYLLTLAEIGLFGFLMFLIFLSLVINRSMSIGMVGIAVIQLFLLGLFDHYLFTLQQGQLLFTLFTSLAFLKKFT